MRVRLHAPMRGGRLREREGAVDERPDPTRRDQRQHVLLHGARDRAFVGDRARASWIAAVPMPDEPPWTSSVSPAFNRPRSKALCQTVKKVSGIAAAVTSVRPGGTGSAWLSCAGQYSA